jgi:hypothetical protein
MATPRDDIDESYYFLKYFFELSSEYIGFQPVGRHGYAQVMGFDV